MATRPPGGAVSKPFPGSSPARRTMADINVAFLAPPFRLAKRYIPRSARRAEARVDKDAARCLAPSSMRQRTVPRAGRRHEHSHSLGGRGGRSVRGPLLPLHGAAGHGGARKRAFSWRFRSRFAAPRRGRANRQVRRCYRGIRAWCRVRGKRTNIRWLDRSRNAPSPTGR